MSFHPSPPPAGALTRRAALFAAGTIAGQALLGSALISPARASTWTDYLDLPRSGRYGDRPGGVNPLLPTDASTLGAALHDARAAGVPPARYAALPQQFWLVRACDAVGIDLHSWDVRAGLPRTLPTVAKCYTLYDRYQLTHRELRWAGMGGLAGPSFAAGLADLQMVMDLYGPQLRLFVAGLMREVAAGSRVVLSRLPSDVADLPDAIASMRTADMALFLQRVLAMQKAIFLDLAPQHEAYTRGGLRAVAEFRAAGINDAGTAQAWVDVGSGDEARVDAGNAAILRREQGAIVGRLWDVAGNASKAARALSYVATFAADPAIPGLAQPPRGFRPLVIDEASTGPTWHLRSPLPAMNWCDFPSRWAYITAEMLPAYRRLVETLWPVAEQALSTPVSTQIERQRVLARFPQLLAELSLETRFYYA